MADFSYTPDNSFEEEIGYKVLVSEFENQVEQRRLKNTSPRRKFHLTFLNRTQTEMENIRDFFTGKYGTYTSFTYDNPIDSVEYTVRFAENSLKITRKAYQIYDLECTFIEVL